MTSSLVKRFSWLGAIAGLLLLLSAPAPLSAARTKWVGTWSSAQIALDPADALPAAALEDITLRQLVRASLGGTRMRIRVSNAFGTSALVIDDARVALAASPGSSRVVPATSRPLTFSGEPRAIVPAGAEYVSDPVLLPFPPLSTLAVSLHFSQLQGRQTGHPGSRASSYVTRGDRVTAAELGGATTVERWYYLAGIDVEAPGRSAAIVVLGDSITDGHGVVTNANGRWTDVLAQRLAGSPATRARGVLNAGIGGNRVVDDGIGPNALARFGRDVLARSGAGYVILLEGVNDLGMLSRDKPHAAGEHRQMVSRIIAAYRQMIMRAHEHAIMAIGATIMPYGGSAYYHPDAASEADRQRLNAWIRARGHFDAVIDFDALMRDPAQPSRLRKDYDSGDGLHPSPAGYRAMGRAVPLSLFGGGG